MSERELKEILKQTKVSADENTTFRVLHQIEAEKALLPKPEAKKISLLQQFENIFGTIAGIVIALGFYFHYYLKISPKDSTTFFYLGLAVVSIGSFYWLYVSYNNYKENCGN